MKLVIFNALDRNANDVIVKVDIETFNIEMVDNGTLFSEHIGNF